MDVTTWRSGSQFGIRVGTANRDEYFKRDWSHFEVEMAGQAHRFELTPGFWHKCPEFRDRGTPAIRSWLQKFKSLQWPRGNPPRMSLISLGDNRFRLLP